MKINTPTKVFPAFITNMVDKDDRDFSSNYGMNKTEKGICYSLIVLSTIYYNLVNVLLILKRKNYVIKHRGIALTIPSAIVGYFIFLNVLCNEVFYPIEFHNVYIWISNLFIVFVIMSSCGRAIRMILLYNLNEFKSECILKIQDFNENTLVKHPKIEVNSYMKTLDNIVKRKTGKWILIIPTIITIIVTAVTELIKSIYEHRPFYIKFIEFAPITIFLMIYNIMCIYFLYSLRKVKDNETFGIKFEVYVSFLSNLFVLVVSMVMNITGSSFIIKYTHSGSFLYIFQTIVGHFVSATIPLILSYHEEKKFKKQSKILSSAEFTKLLYQKTVIDDLKVIAINDFCVENILFWESYIKIKELTYQCLTNTGPFEERRPIIKEENIKAINKNLSDLYSSTDHRHKYIDKKTFRLDGKKHKQKYIELDPYYTYSNDINNRFYSPRVSTSKGNNKNYFTPCDYKDYDIDPNTPLDSRLLPYYISFYKAFIDPYGPVNVNIASDIASNIFKSLFNNPTVGVFDDAKNDVITSMFITLYPQYINLHFNR